jgi:DnaJ family protein B protein 12
MQQAQKHTRGGYHEYDYIREFEADITAEELFNMFFGGGLRKQNVYTRNGGRWHRAENHSQNREQQASGYSTFLQTLPPLFLN